MKLKMVSKMIHAKRIRIKEKMKKRYDVSLDTRKIEIDLFWKRSIFFWGFIAATFIAYAAFSGDKSNSPNLRVVISLFGFACSFCWTLVNRGSKYWQENWEHQVDIIEDKITGPLFKRASPVQKKGIWLQARRYSVSKLTIAISDYVSLIWFGLTSYSLSKLSVVRTFLESKSWFKYINSENLILLFVVVTIIWSIAIIFLVRISRPIFKEDNTP